jgi:L-rhamnose isomerase
MEPHEKLKSYDLEGNAFARLALLERAKTLPLGAVWDRYCEEAGVVNDAGLIDDVIKYEQDVQSKRK